MLSFNPVMEVSVAELSAGMKVAQNVMCQQTGRLLLKEGTILTEKGVSLLRSNGIQRIKISDRYTIIIDPHEKTASEIKRLLHAQIIKYAPEKTEANKSDTMAKVSETARGIAENLVEDDPVISKICTDMRIMHNEMLFRHCINTCALSLLVAGAMGLGETNLYEIGKAALIHDLGLCEMPQLLTANTRNAAEEALWREHARYGYYFAQEAGVREEICEMILCHHEKWDGSGYPGGLSGAAIPLGARIIAVCDSYDNLIRREKYPNYQAIEYCYGSSGIWHDAEVVNTLCNNLAVYPLGSMVRLSTGDVGIVINVRQNLGPRPVVRLFYNRMNKPYSNPKEIDLGVERTVFIKEVI